MNESMLSLKDEMLNLFNLIKRKVIDHCYVVTFRINHFPYSYDKYTIIDMPI